MTPKSPSRLKRLALMISVPALLLAGAGGYFLLSGDNESTQNANLHQARIAIGADLGGRVNSVSIKDLQRVSKGDVLFQIDPEPYRLAVTQAQAAVDAARLAVEQMKVSYAQASAQLRLARDDASFRATEFDRQSALSARGVSTETALDDARHVVQQSAEMRDVAEQGVASALAALGGDPALPTDSHPTVQSALGALAQATYKLSLTTVTAPTSGIVYQASSFREGQMVAAGQSIFTLVDTNDVWVEANFKETQLQDIAVGQAATVVFDSLPNKQFKGRVEGIGAGTGSEFALLPAQNATGNWVKVTQRVPVRIAFDTPADAADLPSGMSAEVVVDTATVGQTARLAALKP